MSQLYAGGINSLCVAHMEVPCYSGFLRAATATVQQAGRNISIRHVMIGRQEYILEGGPVKTGLTVLG